MPGGSHRGRNFLGALVCLKVGGLEHDHKVSPRPYFTTVHCQIGLGEEYILFFPLSLWLLSNDFKLIWFRSQRNSVVHPETWSYVHSTVRAPVKIYAHVPSPASPLPTLGSRQSACRDLPPPGIVLTLVPNLCLHCALISAPPAVFWSSHLPGSLLPQHPRPDLVSSSGKILPLCLPSSPSSSLGPDHAWWELLKSL